MDEPLVERMSDPDPFEAARRLKTSVQCTCKAEKENDVAYLWLYVSKQGIGQSEEQTPSAPLALEHWLNVVDEAAGAGVQWLVVSINAPLTQFPDVWEICRWAQDAHQMSIGIHIFVDALCEETCKAVKSLDPTRTRIFASREIVECLRPLESEGVRLHVAEPSHESSGGACALPSRMVFVNPDGVLYTCGMVEGNEAYRLGTIFEGSIARIVQDSALPHAVPGSDARNPRGCDGCPPMLARFLEAE